MASELNDPAGVMNNIHDASKVIGNLFYHYLFDDSRRS